MVMFSPSALPSAVADSGRSAATITAASKTVITLFFDIAITLFS
jgi:hypothetical protein